MTQSETRVVTYTRVSTSKQGHDGLGMAAQDALLASYVASHGARVVGAYSEVQSGLKERPALKDAIAKARATRSILLCAKLDRIGRRASEVLTLLDKSRVTVVFADTPHASDLQLGIMSVVAQEEARAISCRTRAALSAAKSRGVKLGGPNGAAPLLAYVAANGNGKATAGARRTADEFAREIADFVAPLARKGLSDAAIADALNADGIQTRRGAMTNPDGSAKHPDTRWHVSSVRNLRKRLGV